jgi:Gpi18-like mannosyltransferase
MTTATSPPTPGARTATAAFLATGIAVSLALRLELFWFESIDYQAYFSKWFDYIRDHGRFAALRDSFSDYNSAYLYLLALATYLPVPKLYAIKAISVAFDYVAAAAVYKLVELRHGRTFVPAIACVTMLFLPTVVANGALWAQSDMMYASAILVSLWLLVTGRHGWAFVAFGVAIAFKLQATFLLPLYVVLVARRHVPARHLWLIPMVYLAVILPNWLLGRPMRELLNVYANQVNTENALCANAPNLYQWFPGADFNVFYPAGLLVTAVAVGLAMRRFIKDEDRTPEGTILMAMVFALLSPYLLPKMHDRYFFLADVLSVVYVSYFPRDWAVPVFVVAASGLSYFPFLAGRPVVDLRVASVMMLAGLLVVWRRVRVRERATPGSPPD